MATEEQTLEDATDRLNSGYYVREGQKLTIPNRTITKLSFKIYKTGSPTGNVTFTIHKTSDDSVILSKVWGDAASLQASATWEEVEFDTPMTVDEEVRILCEYGEGDAGNAVMIRTKDADVKADELHTQYWGPTVTYYERASEDVAYIYTYSAGWAGGNVSGVASAPIAKINGVALADIAKVNGIS